MFAISLESGIQKNEIETTRNYIWIRREESSLVTHKINWLFKKLADSEWNIILDFIDYDIKKQQHVLVSILSVINFWYDCQKHHRLGKERILVKTYLKCTQPRLSTKQCPWVLFFPIACTGINIKYTLVLQFGIHINAIRIWINSILFWHVSIDAFPNITTTQFFF